MVAEGVARLYDANTSTESATDALDRAESWVRARNNEVARRWHLTARGLAALLLVTVAMLLCRLSDEFAPTRSALSPSTVNVDASHPPVPASASLTADAFLLRSCRPLASCSTPPGALQVS